MSRRLVAHSGGKRVTGTRVGFRAGHLSGRGLKGRHGRQHGEHELARCSPGIHALAVLSLSTRPSRRWWQRPYDYMFPKPGQSQPLQKWTYVKAVNVDGTPAFVGAGFYPQ